MKKILLATTVLAFAGASFAATVSGKITTQYQKEGSEKTIKTKGEVALSGSKTSSNGITFGGTYKVLVSDAQSNEDSYTRNTNTVAVTTTAGAVANVSTGDGAFSEGEETKSQVNAWISSSFGRVDMGRHSTAARALGGKAFGLQTADSRTIRGITYTTPTLSGFKAAYTWTANSTEEKSIGVGYAGTFSGVNVKLGWGNIKQDSKTETGWGLSAGMMGITLKYAQGTDGDKEKFNSIGAVFETGPFLVEYYRKKSPTSANTDNKNTYLLAEYKVVDGLKVFAKNNEEESEKKTYIGTVINF